MTYSKAELYELLRLAQFPRSAAYDPEWVLENQMGPNVLWLTESLTQHLQLQPGMRVLDLGCGKAVSSIFLAKEFAVKVWAADLWISASENWERIRAAGLGDLAFPIHTEAHTLPFADEFFDVVVSLDAYHYFGTDDLYLGYLQRFIKNTGQIGICVPGIRQEFNEDIPGHLQPYWEWEFCSFHSPDWWRNHWEKTGKVDVELADHIPEGWKLWQAWAEICYEQFGKDYAQREAEMLRADAGRNLGFTRLVARRK